MSKACIRHGLLAVGAVAAMAAGASAGLVGETITADWYFSTFGSSIEQHTFVVSATDVELPADTIVNDSKFDIDLGDDYVMFLFNAGSTWQDVDFNGWHFEDTNGTIPDVIGYTVDSFSSGIGGLGGITLGHDADAFWADFSGMTVADGGDWIKLHVELVPAPGALALFGVAMPMFMRRRR